MEKYELVEQIGEGWVFSKIIFRTYGTVFSARDKNSGYVYAIKRFKDTENDCNTVSFVIQ